MGSTKNPGENKRHFQHGFSSWWLNQPSWKICSSKWRIISPKKRGDNKKNHGKNPAPRIVPLKKKKAIFYLQETGHPGVMVCFVPSHSAKFFSAEWTKKKTPLGIWGDHTFGPHPPVPQFRGGRNRGQILAQTRYGDSLVKLVSRKGPWSCASESLLASRSKQFQAAKDFTSCERSGKCMQDIPDSWVFCPKIQFLGCPNSPKPTPLTNTIQESHWKGQSPGRCHESSLCHQGCCDNHQSYKSQPTHLHLDVSDHCSWPRYHIKSYYLEPPQNWHPKFAFWAFKGTLLLLLLGCQTNLCWASKKNINPSTLGIKISMLINFPK